VAHLTINVPEEHVDALRRELLRAHAERVAALRQALDEYAGSRERLDDLQGALVELADLHHALAQLGWTPGRPGAVTVTAHPEVIADAVAAAGLPEPAAGSDGGERS
jgi:hypothetical protein